MSFKTWFIKKTNREGILYVFVDTLIFKTEKFLNWIKNGHLIRKYRIKKYEATHKIKKLNIGCGNSYYKNYLNTDIFGKIPIDITKKLPFKSNSFDVIYSDQVVEHIYMVEFEKFLKESNRILTKKGMQIIQTPSLKKICTTMYEKSKNKDADFIINSHSKLQNKLVTRASYINDVSHICFQHKYLYDFELINELAKKAGYKKVIQIPNNKLPDKDIEVDTDKFWDLTTETFVLYK